MTEEIRHAFAHPVERAEASSTTPCDRISLRDYVVEVEIGAFQQERGTLQRVRFNIVVEVTPLTGPIDDDVDRILSYDKITEAIAFELAAERLNLLETLAERIATLGGVPVGTPGAIVERRTWHDYSLGKASVAEHLGAVME